MTIEISGYVESMQAVSKGRVVLMIAVGNDHSRSSYEVICDAAECLHYRPHTPVLITIRPEVKQP